MICAVHARARLSLLAGTCLLVLGATLAFAFARGDFAREAGAIAAMPWGMATLVDVYVGYALFAAWVAARERTLPAIGWIAALLCLGNVVSATYVLLTVRRAAGARGTP